MFYNEFIKYGLNSKNKLNLDEVVEKIIKDFKLDKKDKMYLIYNSVKRLSYEFYNIVSFYPFQLNLEQ